MMQFLSMLVSPISNYLSKREETKKAKTTGEQKIAAAKLKGDKTITLTDQEWEAIATSKQDSTWKDEYVTIVITSPILLIIVGCVYFALTGDGRLITGAVDAIGKLKEIGLNIGDMMTAVVYAAIGLKIWRQK